MELNQNRSFIICWFGTERLNIDQANKIYAGDIVKDILYFNDDEVENCVECLRLISNENILLIIQGMANNMIVLDNTIFTDIHNLHQVKKIYVDVEYSNHKSFQLFHKVRQTSKENLFLRIQYDSRAYSQVIEPFIYSTVDEQSSMAINGDFIHFHMLIDSFVDDRFRSKILANYSTFAKTKSEFIKFLKEEYKNNLPILKTIEEFEQTYKPEKALFWYTKSSFLYTLLNRSLRTDNIKIILHLRFFIIDLYKQLREQCGKPFIEENQRNLFPKYYVYRGQIMSKNELNNLRKSLGNIISMKSFLSTSLDRQMALFYLGESVDPHQQSWVRVLLEIDLGNNDCSMNYEKPYANITEQSDFGREKEILFMVGSYFRVNDVRHGDEGIWYVRMGIVDLFSDPLDKQKRSGALYNHMRTSFIHSALTSSSNTGIILFQSGKFDQAETYYQQIAQHFNELVYLSEDMEDNDEHQLSTYSKYKTGEYPRFVTNLASYRYDRQRFENEKSLTILFCGYILARITHEKGHYVLSIQYYETLLKGILPSSQVHEQASNSVNHIIRALCRLGLGSSYELNGQLKLAFESYTKALHMFEQAHNGYFDNCADGSDLTHVYKGHCLIGLGNLSVIEQKFQRAISYYRKALALFDKYLPIGHPDQIRARQKIANINQIYYCKSDIALESYKDCLENYLRVLPSDHVDIARIYTDMALIYEKLNTTLNKALEYAEKAENIFKKALPEQHTDNITISMIIKRIQRKLSM